MGEFPASKGVLYVGELSGGLEDAVDKAYDLLDDEEGEDAVYCVAFTLESEVKGVLDGDRHDVALYIVPTLLPTMVEIARQVIDRMAKEWEEHNWGEVDDTYGTFTMIADMLVYTRDLTRCDLAYIRHHTNRDEEVSREVWLEYVYFYMLDDAKEQGIRRLFQRWSSKTRAARVIRRAVTEWATRPNGAIARVAMRNVRRRLE